MADEKRAFARRLAAESIAAGEPTAWFETLYAAAEAGDAVVPWADLEPNPLLVRWAAAAGRAHGGAALVVGCGLGDDAEFLAGLGYRTVAFDVAPTAVAGARRRFPGSAVEYVAADLLDPPAGWLGAFDLVFESYTVQVLQGAARAAAIANCGALVAPGGELLVLARAREDADEPGAMPWPLTRAEMEAFATGDFQVVHLEAVHDHEEPPVRRWTATLRRRVVESAA
ncbi:methyltransferase domain-containing protein [Dactylosporangium darangshiense]|uniref:Methyltransferase domain-containing protein n=1 Tax=Dactylosporangium darangshiense TaxID=579108 RepID=A0ABP8D9M2_9ACTN